MGQIGTLRRISVETFNEAVETEVYPPWERNKAHIDVDKLWEAIMYIFGKGNIDHDLAVYLFIPQKMAVLEEGEYMNEGIHYHDHDQIDAYCRYFEQNPVEALISSLDMAAMEQAQLYAFHRADLEIIKDLMHEIVHLFQCAKEEGDIIIGHIG